MEKNTNINEILQKFYHVSMKRILKKIEKVYQYEPYNIDIYKKILTQLKKGNKYHILRMKDFPHKLDTKKINVILRHDIDSMGCVANLCRFLEVENSAGVRSSSYIRVDRVKYQPENCYRAIDKYNSLGFEFGLHSSCYTCPDYMERFAWEVKEFQKIFNICPESFTQHGMGKKYCENRMQFNNNIGSAKQKNNIKVTDCAGYDTQYFFKVTDARWCEKNKRRYITNFFVSLPKFPSLSNGKVFLILTHPCYWNV